LEFRLTYQGPLTSDNRGRQHAGRAKEKHEIRKHFHKQLKRLWSINDNLNDRVWSEPGASLAAKRDGKDVPYLVGLAENFPLGTYRFCPIATKRLYLSCSLKILFLRCGTPGAVKSGDIDNRIKTLLDGLKRPTQMSELGTYLMPDADECPFFVLLEDDDMIANLAVETDTLLEPLKENATDTDARVVVSVKLSPYRATFENLSFL
jgi:hypothetical protein